MESFEPGKIDGHNIFTGGYGVNNKRIQVGDKFYVDYVRVFDAVKK